MSLYSPETDPKYQRGEAPKPEGFAGETIVSIDTLRDDRLPPGQHRTRKWPVLHATTVPAVNATDWRLSVDGLVQQPLQLDLHQFAQLPRIKVFGDFHCVTKWSRLGNLWEGVSLRHLLAQAGPQTNAKFAVIGAYDDNWTTNLPLDALQDTDVLLADTHDGSPIDSQHGGPVRLVVPRLFAWKSAKWICRITLTTDNQPGYWERHGYHDIGDPWQEQRFRNANDAT